MLSHCKKIVLFVYFRFSEEINPRTTFVEYCRCRIVIKERTMHVIKLLKTKIHSMTNPREEVIKSIY